MSYGNRESWIGFRSNHESRTTNTEVKMTDSRSTGRPIEILLIEDNPGDARLIQEMLADASAARTAAPQITLEHANQLSAGLACLSKTMFDIILLDLGLPDSVGIDTLLSTLKHAPDVPVIILTGTADEELAVKAAQSGAQDYLVKGQFYGDLLLRSIRYTLERHRLLAELEAMKQREEQERELLSLNQLSRPPPTAVTAQLFDMAPLIASLPDTFEELVVRYSELLDQALEQRAYKVDYDISGNLRSLAEQMGFLKAGPRDIVKLHSTAMQRKTRDVVSAKAQAYLEEGRVLVLELMGYLSSFYRNSAFGTL
jgi:DNA-binding response OmpR family regulator